MKSCYCNSNEMFSKCCEPFLLKTSQPKTPEQLMRSRYTAYVLHDADYLMATTHVSERKFYAKSEILQWSKQNTWIKLEVIAAAHDIVEFKAHYLDENLSPKVHHEKSTFKKVGAMWYYFDGIFEF